MKSVACIGNTFDRDLPDETVAAGEVVAVKGRTPLLLLLLILILILIFVPGTVFPYTLPMIVNRIAGGCLAAVSFILFGLVMSARGSSTVGIEVMDRLGLPFVLLFLAAQLVVCLIYVRLKDRLVPLLLFAGGTILYAVMTGTGGGPGPAAPCSHGRGQFQRSRLGGTCNYRRYRGWKWINHVCALVCKAWL